MPDPSSAAVVAVVDDDPSILQSLEFLLESADHSVLVFASAGAFFQSGCVAAIDCLISDIDMPAIDGFDLLRAVHDLRPSLPVILITGHPEMLEGVRAAGAGHHALLRKPFEGEALLAAVSRAVAITKS